MSVSYEQQWSEWWFMQIVDKYADKNSDNIWNWIGISSNPNITLDIIEKYPNKPWDWGRWGMSSNPNLHNRSL